MAHKVFVSYHHEKDQSRANYLREVYGRNDMFIDKSLSHALDDMSDDEILAYIRQNNLRDSTVTIVLIGEETANRKRRLWFC